MADGATELLDLPADEIADDEGFGGESGGVPPTVVIAADLLVEEISIDGMCGVY
jgi:mycofactocin precursor